MKGEGRIAKDIKIRNVVPTIATLKIFFDGLWSTLMLAALATPQDLVHILC